MKIGRLSFHFGVKNSKKPRQSDKGTNEVEISRIKKTHVHSFCSFQNRVGPPEYRKWRRVHGLQLPLHPQQIAGWTILLAVGGGTFFVMIPALRSYLRESLCTILAVLFGVHLVSHLIALLLDPADPELRALKTNYMIPEFDRSQHTHVIENGRCHLCNIKISSSKTKHCSICNKCIDQFDHHCKWLNHCIGGRNYVPFLICVMTAVVASIIVVGVSVLEVVYYHVDPALLTVFPSKHNETVQEFLFPAPVFLGLTIVLGLFAATTAGLLLHLCLFHCYISMLGISTYEYIRSYRQGATDNEQPQFDICPKKNLKVNSIDIVNSENIGNRRIIASKNNMRSRPEELEEESKKCRFGSDSCLFRTVNSIDGRCRKKTFLKHQTTDPESVKRTVKPSLILFREDQKNPDELVDRGTSTVFETRSNESDKSQKGNQMDEPSTNFDHENLENSNEAGLLHANLKFVCPKNTSEHSVFDIKTFEQIKNNQISPAVSAEEEPKAILEEPIPLPDGEILLNSKTARVNVTPTEKILPAIDFFTSKLENPGDLKGLSNALDLINVPIFDFSNFTKTVGKKKIVNKLKSSPKLSPIKENGSNPESPNNIDLILPATPAFERLSSPELSVMFLSNTRSLSFSTSSSSSSSSPSSPSSPSSSAYYFDENRCKNVDGNEGVVRSNLALNRLREKNEIHKTPQLPRKIYRENRREHVFFVKPSNNRPTGKWIDSDRKI